MTDNNTNWDQLTPEQKRQEKLKSYINTEGINFASEKDKEAYLTRGQRMIDVYNVSEPDRVPVNLPVGDLPYLLHDMTALEARTNPEKAKAAIDDFNKKYSIVSFVVTTFLFISFTIKLLPIEVYIFVGIISVFFAMKTLRELKVTNSAGIV